MSLFKTEKPSRDKEKAIRSVQEIGIKMGRIGLNIPAELKRRLKDNSNLRNIPYTDIVISLIENYLQIEEQKED